MLNSSLLRAGVMVAVLALLAACNSQSPSVSPESEPSGSTIIETATGTIFNIVDDDGGDASDPKIGEGTYQDAVLTAFFQARSGDCIEFEEGSFHFTTSLVMSHKENICIKGQGQDKTILSFSESSGSDGFALAHMNGITVEDLTIMDTPGFSIRVSDSDFVTLRNMRTMWSSFEGSMKAEVPSTLYVECNGLDANEQDVEVVANAQGTGSPVTAAGAYTDENGASRQFATDTSNGGYAIYPVLSNNVLIDNVIAIGASDAGVYVGQSNDVIIKNSLAMFNVAGYEIENTDRADMFDNRALCNTGGFLVFDLPNLNQYGDQTRMFRNVSRYNNWPNFAPVGGVVAAVPYGTGVLQLGYDQVEVFENFIFDNSTAGYIFVSLELIEEGLNDRRMDLYPEGLHVHDNVFRRNGQMPQPPEPEAVSCSADNVMFDPANPQDTQGVCTLDTGHDSLLPALVQIKALQANDGFAPLGADIIWDGYMDDDINTNSGIHAGTDSGGNCELEDQQLDPSTYEIDFKGKPKYDISHSPACRTNFYKYAEGDGNGNDHDEFLQVTSYQANGDSAPKSYQRIHPRWWNCIDSNSYSGVDENGTSRPDGANVRPYLNFVDTEPSNPPRTDISVHDCRAIFGDDVHDESTDGTPDQSGTRMPPLPAAVVETFEPGQDGEPVLSDEEILAICENFSGSAINRDALAHNCPKLSHYNLFADPTDPRTGFNEDGYLYTLSTPLFSDYSSKYRVIWLNEDDEKLGWRLGNRSAEQETLHFPVGSIIAKTFTFKTEDNAGNLLDEKIIETRLLIHRETLDGDSFWEGFSYIWEQDDQGNYIDANIALAGGKATDVSWKYQDPHPLVDTVYDSSTHDTSTLDYSIPHPNQCGECHTNDDRPAGDAPIGPKVRLMNEPLYNAAGTVVGNQLQDMIDRGLLEPPEGGLTIDNGFAINTFRLPTFNVPVSDNPAMDTEFINIPLSSSDGDADTKEDGVHFADTTEYRTEMRARAWLETNCAHCHNNDGISRQTGFFMDVFRRVDSAHGICQSPIVGGSNTDGRDFNFHPGNPDNSIVLHRIGISQPGSQMPPVARSVVHDEGVALIRDWVESVLDASYPDANCASE